MMTSFGRPLFLLVGLLCANLALAAVTVKLDRSSVALGDTLQLSITADGNESLGDIDLQPLQQDFEILQRSSSSNTSIINGARSHSNSLVLTLTPRRQGDLEIPALRVGQQLTQRLPVTVGAPPDIDTGDANVVFEAEVDRDTVYVQAQVILTLRVLQAINLDDRSISDLSLPDAFVKPLEQNSFRRTINGRQWLVHEVRYAIFPEQSGTLEIPAQVFSARIPQGRRSLFDIGRGGPPLRRSTAPISIEVLPRPDSYTAAEWLPARDITLSERWSTPPEQLKVGESATRTVEIQGEGLQGAQLPPISFPPVDGLKYYPDQPQISEREVSSGLLGIRSDSAAVVPTRAGTFLIPEIRIPWWDTESEQLRYAVIPERSITVAAGASPTGVPEPAAALPEVGQDIEIIAAGQPATSTTWIWQLATAVSALGWLCTLLYLWLRRPTAADRTAVDADADGMPEKAAFRELLSACNRGNPAAARAALIAWTAALTGKAEAPSLEGVARQFGDERLARELAILDASLYGSGGRSWVGSSLAEQVQALRAQYRKGKAKQEQALSLYP